MSGKFEEVTVRTKPIYEGSFITLQVDEVRLPDGRLASREIVRHPGAVAVLAFVEDKLLMVDQYRKPLGRMQLEIPAGKLERGEDPLQAARRELEEETGYTCTELEPVAAFYTSPGFADEYLHLYAAGPLSRGSFRPDEDEFLEVKAVSLEQAKQHIAAGTISDAKTILAVYAWQMKLLTGSYRC